MKRRVAIFGSFRRGESLINGLLSFMNEHPDTIEFCGIATDDPFSPKICPDRRVWQYLNGEEKNQWKKKIEKLAHDNNVPFWDGSVKEKEFFEIFKVWNPDIVYIGTFGQRVPPHIFEQPLFGTINFHPTVDRIGWPAYVGGNPFQMMLNQSETEGVLAMHEVNENFDDGALIAYSKRFSINPAKDTVLSLHERSSPEAGKMMAWHLCSVCNLPEPKYELQPQISMRFGSCPAVTTQTRAYRIA